MRSSISRPGFALLALLAGCTPPAEAPPGAPTTPAPPATSTSTTAAPARTFAYPEARTVDAAMATARTGNGGVRQASEKGDTAGATVSHIGADTFTTVVAERGEAILEQARIVGGRLLVVWMVDAAQHLEVRDLDGASPREVPLQAATVIGAVSGREDGPVAHLVLSSIARPPELWTLDMATAKLTLAERPKSEVDPDAYPAELAALLAYSPYHNVVAGKAYPPLLVASSDSDARVDPMHARKFVARMQAAGSGGPILLRVESDAGHGGADGVKRGIERFGDQLSFLWHHASRDAAKPEVPR